ncbi:MAG: IS630 family transposase [Rickettsia hoogstraalii]
MVATAHEQSKLNGLKLEVMFQDESRFGRINDIKRCWSYKGNRPAVAKQIIREYSYIYGAFSPITGVSDMLILPFMTVECMNIFLQELSIRHPDKFILLICDGASNHRQASLKIPENVMIQHLPPLSPQLNPSENMWEEIKEKFFYNQLFHSMEDLLSRMSDAILKYEAIHQTVKSITCWNWIINPINSILKDN